MSEAMTPEIVSIKIKKAAKLLWRHAFTLFILLFIVHGIFKGYTLQGENACGVLLGAILLDWFKMKLSPQCGNFRGFQRTESLQSQNPLNEHLVGTPTYLSNLGHNQRYQ